MLLSKRRKSWFSVRITAIRIFSIVWSLYSDGVGKQMFAELAAVFGFGTDDQSDPSRSEMERVAKRRAQEVGELL